MKYCKKKKSEGEKSLFPQKQFHKKQKREQHKLKIIITLRVPHKYRHQKIEVSYSKCSI